MIRMRWSTVVWIGWGVYFFAAEGWYLFSDPSHKGTLSQTLQRAFSHAPWETVLAFGAFVAWFTLHIWARLVQRKKK